MKTLLAVFITMYVIEDVFNFICYKKAQKMTLTEITEKAPGPCTYRMMCINWSYSDFGDYMKNAVIGAIARFVLSPVAMVGIAAVAYEYIRKAITGKKIEIY